jgi:hypothetical protein
VADEVPAPPDTVAPPTTAADEVPGPPDTVAPPSTAVGGAVDPTTPIRSDEAADFVAGYYDLVGRGDYETAWALLSPEFQGSVPGTFERYVAFWDATDIEIRGLVPLASDVPGEIVVQIDARYTSDSRTVDEVDELTLRRADDGSIRIVDQRIVG